LKALGSRPAWLTGKSDTRKRILVNTLTRGCTSQQRYRARERKARKGVTKERANPLLRDQGIFKKSGQELKIEEQTGKCGAA